MNSVKIRSVDTAAIESAVTSYVAGLFRNHPEIEKIIWCGSWVTGIPVPGSDVDLCIILTMSDLRARERLPLYLPTGFPTGIDLFVYTLKEFAHLQETSTGFYRAVMRGKEFSREKRIKS